ncbi:MAG: host attachment protein [Acidobacteriota bacterium]
MELKALQKHILTLATLQESNAPVVSCYLNLTADEYLNVLDERVRVLRRSLSGEPLHYFEDALRLIDTFLATGVQAGTKGVAVFARGGQQPFFLPLQFRVSLPNWIAAASTPNIYHLIELKDTYHRYVVMLATAKSVRILAINLGSVTQDLWTQRPELRQRVGREWTKEHYQSHRRERTNQFINEQIAILDRLMSAGGYGHLVLAGNPRVTSEIRKALPKHLAAKVVDVVPASEYDPTSDVVAATLASFIEKEERESVAVVDKLQKEINTHGLAVADTRASFEALRQGQVDVLVLAKAYEPDAAWICGACGATEVEQPAPDACPQCRARKMRQFNVKEEMVRVAEQMGSEVEVVNHSDTLMRLGGVGCLLRFLGSEKYHNGGRIKGKGSAGKRA